MTVTVKISSKNQIVIPKEAREALSLRAGDRLLVTVRGDAVVELEKQPEDVAAALEGILPGVTLESHSWEEILE